MLSLNSWLFNFSPRILELRSSSTMLGLPTSYFLSWAHFFWLLSCFMLPLTGGSWLCSFWTSVALAAVQGRAGSICWNLAINCLGGDGEWVEHARGRSVGHPPSSAVPARRQLLALLDSWQSVVCCLLAGHVNPIWGGWMMKLLSDHLWVLFPPSHSHFTYFLRLALCGPRLSVLVSWVLGI